MLHGVRNRALENQNGMVKVRQSRLADRDQIAPRSNGLHVLPAGPSKKGRQSKILALSNLAGGDHINWRRRKVGQQLRRRNKSLLNPPRARQHFQGLQRMGARLTELSGSNTPQIPKKSSALQPLAQLMRDAPQVSAGGTVYADVGLRSIELQQLDRVDLHFHRSQFDGNVLPRQPVCGSSTNLFGGECRRRLQDLPAKRCEPLFQLLATESRLDRITNRRPRPIVCFRGPAEPNVRAVDLVSR